MNKLTPEEKIRIRVRSEAVFAAFSLSLLSIFNSCAPTGPAYKATKVLTIPYGEDPHSIGVFRFEENIYVPTDAVVDPSGNIYWMDKFNHRIIKFNRYGKFLYSQGGEGTEAGKLGDLRKITVDSFGNCYAFDIKQTDNRTVGEIVKFGELGKTEVITYVNHVVHKMEIDRQNNLYLYFLGGKENEIWKVSIYSPEGELSGTITLKTSDVPIQNYFADIDDVFVNPLTGKLYALVSYYTETSGKAEHRLLYVYSPSAKDGIGGFVPYARIENEKREPFAPTWDGKYLFWERLTDRRHRIFFYDLQQKMFLDYRNLILDKKNWVKFFPGMDGNLYGIVQGMNSVTLYRFH